MSIESQIVLCVSTYKIISLLTGLAFSYMGYQLFVKKITGNAGSVDGSGAGYKLRIMNAAPGTFFAVFGAIIVAYTIGTKLSFERETTAPVGAQVAAAGEGKVSDVTRTESLVAAASKKPDKPASTTKVEADVPGQVHGGFTAVGSAGPRSADEKPVATPVSTNTKALGK